LQGEKEYYLIPTAEVPVTNFVRDEILDATVLPKSFPIIRYAEILLSYVEALNNLTGSHTVTFSDESPANPPDSEPY
jgi:hypothetical protein